jgi:hypothetical protein
MAHFIVLSEAQAVLGVWSTPHGVAASRWAMELGLTYPGCRVQVEQAPDFDALKSRLPELCFGAHAPEPVDPLVRKRAPSSPGWTAAAAS